MACCGQPAAGYQFVWHLRGLPGQAEPIEYPDQGTALREQRNTHGGAGVVMRVTKKIS